MQESAKSFLIKDLLRDLVHNVDSSTQGIHLILCWNVVLSACSETKIENTNRIRIYPESSLFRWKKNSRKSQVPHYFISPQSFLQRTIKNTPPFNRNNTTRVYFAIILFIPSKVHPIQWPNTIGTIKIHTLQILVMLRVWWCETSFQEQNVWINRIARRRDMNQYRISSWMKKKTEYDVHITTIML